MDKITVLEARKKEAIGKKVIIQGWVRTRRDSKGGFSFLEVNDGSCMGNVQVIAEAALDNYESEILTLGVGSSISVEGEVANDRASSTTHQHIRRRDACAKLHLSIDPRFLSGRGLSLRSSADHHRERLRRRRTDVSRLDH